MSGSGSVLGSHDVTERLSWELQAPTTVRPQDFAAFPAKTNWEVERKKMQAVCNQCHGSTWTEGQYARIDAAVKNFDELYYKPAKALLDELYAKKLIPETPFFQTKFQWDFYSLWHYEGRRARMGTAMMAPDYSWWHGFYECKQKLCELQEQAHHMISTNTPAFVYKDFPGKGGDTNMPTEVNSHK